MLLTLDITILVSGDRIFNGYKFVYILSIYIQRIVKFFENNENYLNKWQCIRSRPSWLIIHYI
jgi:hypothetical protein